MDSDLQKIVFHKSSQSNESKSESRFDGLCRFSVVKPLTFVDCSFAKCEMIYRCMRVSHTDHFVLRQYQWGVVEVILELVNIDLVILMIRDLLFNAGC